MTTEPVVLVEVTDAVATITLNRPESRNALNPELAAAFPEAVAACDAREDVLAIILTGADPAFCAGFDLRELAGRERGAEPGPPPPFRAALPPHRTPIIGAINGAAVTGGFELALACDFLIASDRARFADTHARVGVLPGWGLTVMLPEAIGIRRAKQLSLSGAFLDARTALDWGLVSEVVAHEDLLPRAREIATMIAANPPHAVQSVLALYDEVAELLPADAWRVENERARRWMVEGFNRPGLAERRNDIVETGRRLAAGTAEPGAGSLIVQVFAGMSDRVGLRDVIAYARRVEALGYDGLHVPETVHDGLAASLLALEHTERLIVRTSVVLAFPRSPMLTAYGAWDLAAFSDGRFQLGLGTQIKQNVVGRFSVPWTEPVTRMRDYVESLRAIWHSFQTGAPLSYESENYTFSRLQPFFNPGPLAVTPPSIWLGGVKEGMVGLAGSHADGIVTHPTNSNPRYLREICLPALMAGHAAAGGGQELRPGFQIISGSQYVTGPTPADVDRNREHHRRLLAFLYSTPAYRRTLTLHGWEDLGERLQTITRTQAWETLHEHVTDEVIDALVPQGTWDQLPAIIEQWFGGLCDGVILPLPEDPGNDARFAEIIAAVQRT